MKIDNNVVLVLWYDYFKCLEKLINIEVVIGGFLFVISERVWSEIINFML